MAFDIAKIDVIGSHESGCTVEIDLPDGTPTDFKIKVRGKESAQVKKVTNAQSKSVQRDSNMARKKGKDLEWDLDDFEKQAVDLAVAATISWENLTENGKVVEFSPEEARKIYTKNKWIVKQVNTASENDALFL